MKIVHTEASCGWGGQEIRILDESLGMIERGHDVQLLCPPEARIFEEAGKRGVPVTALPIGKKNVRGILAMRKWLQANRVDVVNTHSSTDSWLTALACATIKQAPPIVRTRHISAPVSNNAATRWLYTKATKHIVTTGESLRQTLAQVNGFPLENITSVPTGIDTQKFAPGDKQATRAQLGLNPALNYIGIVATLRSWKGHLYLLEAFAAFNQPDWHLLIIGDGPMRDVLIDKIRELGIEGKVTLTGQQANPQDWLRALDVFCLPSYANEGVPQAILQAMLTGLPIITTTVGAITEAVVHGESGIIVPPQDAPALVSALAGLTNASAEGTSLGQRARDRAKTYFSRESMLDRMQSIFAGTLK